MAATVVCEVEFMERRDVFVIGVDSMERREGVVDTYHTGEWRG